MVREKLTLPKLPPGKRVEQVLAMRETDFAEVAKGAGMSPEKLRETLEKILSRSTAEGQAASEAEATRREKARARAQKVKKDRAPKVFSAEAGFREGLKRFLFEDVRTASETDEKDAFADADTFSSGLSGEYEPQNPHYHHSIRLYRSAYRIRLMRRLQKALLREGGDSKFRRTHRRIVDDAHQENQAVNFHSQREGFYLAIHDFAALDSPEQPQARALYDALNHGEELTPAQKYYMEGVVAGRSSRKVPYSLSLAMAVEHVFRENGLREGRSNMVIGGMAGLNGSFEYSRHSRPHRDDHSASGGRDDK